MNHLQDKRNINQIVINNDRNKHPITTITNEHVSCAIVLTPTPIAIHNRWLNDTTNRDK